MALFVGWVLLPFVGLMLADRMSGRWSQFTRKTLYVVMLVVAVASMAASGVLHADERIRHGFGGGAVLACSP